jgi:predicted dienelactone hydrolase
MLALALAACGQGHADADVDVDADQASPDADADADADTEGDADADGEGDAPDADADAGGLGPLPPQPADAIGPYPVGVLTLDLADPARDDRPLPTEVWYPALEVPGAMAVRYDVVANELRLAVIESPNHAVRDAPPDRSAGPRPFIVFSHGSGGLRQQSIFLTEYLASHGFIVAAPDHTGNLLGDVMFGGDDQGMAQSALDRPADVSFVIDQLVERTAEVVPALDGLIDAARIGVTGHSFGGYTSLAVSGAELNLGEARAFCAEHPDELACSMLDLFAPEQQTVSFRDERVDASVPLAPGGFQIFGAAGIATTAVPTLIQAGDIDRTTPLEEEQEPMFAALPGPAWLAVIAGAGHFTFSDVCILVDIYGEATLEQLGVNILTDGCGDENIDIDVAHQIINTLTTALFQMELQDDAAAVEYLVSGTNVEVSP